MQITVDGCEYKVVHESLNGTEEITVYTASGHDDAVCWAIVNHNMEQVFVTYNLYACEDGEEITTTYPYFEFTTADELARWLVETHPEMSDMSVKNNKYITYLGDSQEKIMVIFDPEEAHADVARRMSVWPISAGHLTITSNEGTIVVEVVCFGESTTLDLTPNEEDTLIAKRMLGL